MYADEIHATNQTALDLLYVNPPPEPIILAAADYLVRQGNGNMRYVRIDSLPVRTAEPDILERGVLFALENSTITIRESSLK